MKKDASFLLLIDITRGFVSATIAEYSGSDIEIVGYEKVRTGSSFYSDRINIEGVVGKVELAISGAEKQARISVPDVVFCISDEITSYIFSGNNYRRADTRTKISRAEVEALIDKVHEKHEKQAFESGVVRADSGLQLLYSSIVSASLDGIAVDSLQGLKGGLVKIQIATTFVPVFYVSLLEKICIELDLNLLNITTSSLSTYSYCVGTDSKFSGIVCDIRDEYTNALVIVEGEFNRLLKIDVGAKSIGGERNSSGKGSKEDSDGVGMFVDLLSVALTEINPEILPERIYLSCSDAKLTERVAERLIFGDEEGSRAAAKKNSQAGWYEDAGYRSRPVIDSFEDGLHDFRVSDKMGLAENGLVFVGQEIAGEVRAESSRISSKLRGLLKF